MLGHVHIGYTELSIIIILFININEINYSKYLSQEKTFVNLHFCGKLQVFSTKIFFKDMLVGVAH